MVVGIFYFLARALLVMNLLAFVIYGIGILMFLRLMLQQTNVKYRVLDGLRALTADTLSATGRQIVGVADSWLQATTSVFLNVGYWVL